jgi:phosphoglycerate dehydrogenase-like enzyme
MLCFMGALERAPHLRWLQISWVGVDFDFVRGVLNSASESKRFRVTNAAGANAPPIATSVLAGLLALHRRLNLLMRAQVRGRALPRDV